MTKLALTDEDRAALAKIVAATFNRPVAREERIALHFLAAGIERGRREGIEGTTPGWGVTCAHYWQPSHSEGTAVKEVCAYCGAKRG